jgi:hypothetical protein
MRKKKVFAVVLSLSLLMTGTIVPAGEISNTTEDMNPVLNEATDEILNGGKSSTDESADTS